MLRLTAIATAVFSSVVLSTIALRADNFCAEFFPMFEAQSPFAYRVLAPALLGLMPGAAGQIVFNLLVFTALYVLLDLWLCGFVSPDRASVGVLLVSTVYGVMAQTYLCAFYTPLEGVLLLCGLLLMQRWSVLAR